MNPLHIIPIITVVLMVGIYKWVWRECPHNDVWFSRTMEDCGMHYHCDDCGKVVICGKDCVFKPRITNESATESARIVLNKRDNE